MNELKTKSHAALAEYYGWVLLRLGDQWHWIQDQDDSVEFRYQTPEHRTEILADRCIQLLDELVGYTDPSTAMITDHQAKEYEKEIERLNEQLQEACIEVESYAELTRIFEEYHPQEFENCERMYMNQRKELKR